VSFSNTTNIDDVAFIALIHYLYTGLRSWRDMKSLSELVKQFQLDMKLAPSQIEDV
jgi:hypothetical protein